MILKPFQSQSNRNCQNLKEAQLEATNKKVFCVNLGWLLSFFLRICDNISINAAVNKTEPIVQELTGALEKKVIFRQSN